MVAPQVVAAGSKAGFLRSLEPSIRSKKLVKEHLGEGCLSPASTSSCGPPSHRRQQQLLRMPQAMLNGRSVNQDGVEGGFKGSKYVPLEQARAMVDEASAAQQRETVAAQDRLSLLQSLLDNAVQEREELQRELRRTQEEALIKEKKLKSTTSERDTLKDTVAKLEKQLCSSNTIARNASLHVAVKLEERIKAAFSKQHKVELDTLQAQLKAATTTADKAELEANQRMSQAELNVVKAVEEALGALEDETEAALLLAQMSAVVSREAAEQSSLVARTAISEQRDALERAQAIRKEAVLAHERGAAANAEADTLQKEVELLREKLEDAHKQVSDAVSSASSSQKEFLERAAAAEKKAAARVVELEAAFNTLRQAEQQKAASAEEQARLMQGRVELLTKDVERLRTEISAAQQSMVQAESQRTALEAQLSDRIAEIQKQADELLEDERKLLESEKAKWGISNREALLAEVDAVVAEISKKLEASKSGNIEYLESLHRALQVLTRDRDYWKKRAMLLEESLKQASAQLSPLNDGNSGGAATVQPADAPAVPAASAGRMQTALPKRRLWELFARGPNTKEEPRVMDEVMKSMEELLANDKGEQSSSSPAAATNKAKTSSQQGSSNSSKLNGSVPHTKKK